MDRWVGKVCIVTGASAGIGSAIAVALADAGVNVVGLARRDHLVNALQTKVKGTGKIVGRHCDVSNSAQVEETFNWVEEEYGCIHMLINNAAILKNGHITEMGNEPLSEEILMNTIDINLKGTIMCTKRAVACMKRHQFDGHIVMLNSIAGHYEPFSSKFNVYPATKHAITALTISLLNEMGRYKSKIKFTSISPGLTETEMVTKNAIDQLELPSLKPESVAGAVMYVLSTPPDVNINELTISPITERRL